jgi:hypothetical protein
VPLASPSSAAPPSFRCLLTAPRPPTPPHDWEEPLADPRPPPPSLPALVSRAPQGVACPLALPVPLPVLEALALAHPSPVVLASADLPLALAEEEDPQVDRVRFVLSVFQQHPC